MKEELEKIKREFNERIDALILKNSNTPFGEFEVGKWYKSSFGNLVNYQSEVNSFGFSYSTFTWSNNLGFPKTRDWVLSTESEVKEALIKEAEKRGFKEGVEFVCINSDSKKKSGYKGIYRENELKYYPDIDVLCGGGYIYCKGVWATPIKDSPIKIGGYEVTKGKDSFGVYYNIGCKTIRYDSLLNISQVMGLNSFKKIKLDEYETDITTINTILEKLK